jgi:hypothetical protein
MMLGSPRASKVLIIDAVNAKKPLSLPTLGLLYLPYFLLKKSLAPAFQLSKLGDRPHWFKIRSR